MSEKKDLGRILTKDFFEREYMNLGKTYRQIGDEIGCSKSSVMYWADKMGIESRCIGHRTKHLEGKRFGSLVAVKEERNESGYAG